MKTIKNIIEIIALYMVVIIFISLIWFATLFEEKSGKDDWAAE